jgi:hypothetical protein
MFCVRMQEMTCRYKRSIMTLSPSLAGEEIVRRDAEYLEKTINGV